MKAPIVLPADAYDTLEMSAMIFGGIGAGDWTEGGLEDGAPFCKSGHALFCDPSTGMELNLILMNSGLGIVQNDRAVPAINRRKHSRNLSRRVTWAEYRRELGIVRGD